MMIRRRALILGYAAAFLFSAGLFAQQAAPQQRKLSDAEKKEIQTVLKIVDDAAAGTASPNDLSLVWINDDLLKAQGNKQYVPFNVSIDPAKISGGKLSLYWRVVSKDGAAAAAAPAANAKKDDKKPSRPEFAYEDLNMINVPSGQAAPMRV